MATLFEAWVWLSWNRSDERGFKVSIQRATVLKVPDTTPGLLFVNGQQKSFQIDGIWRSTSVAPAPNLTVQVELNDAGQILSIQPVSESDLVKEQLEKTRKLAEEKGKALAGTAISRVGKEVLIATALLIIGWFFLDLFSFKMSFFVPINIHPTFWQSIGTVKAVQNLMENPMQALELASTTLLAGKSSTGFYGFLAILSLLGPLLPLLWRDKRAPLGAVLPLLFTLFLGFQCYRIIATVKDLGRSAAAQTGMTAEQVAAAQIQAEEGFKTLTKSVKFELGLGFYLSAAATLFLTGAGIRKYLLYQANPDLLGHAESVAWQAPAAPVAANPPQPLSPQASAIPSCLKCQQPLELGSKFCAECGERVG